MNEEMGTWGLSHTTCVTAAAAAAAAAWDGDLSGQQSLEDRLSTCQPEKNARFPVAAVAAAGWRRSLLMLYLGYYI